MSHLLIDKDRLMVMQIGLVIRRAECAAAAGIAYDEVDPEPLKGGVVREVDSLLRDIRLSSGRPQEPLTGWLTRMLAGVSPDEQGVCSRIWDGFADEPPPGYVMDMKDSAGRATRESELVPLQGSHNQFPKAVGYAAFKSKVSRARPR